MTDHDPHRWYPIAGAEDTPERHVHQARLLGHELAVWRADDGYLNVWENRCLHRGVRLSIGINDGRELRCQYHGWRYANRSGGCTYIPAHPADAPARTICTRTYPAHEQYGITWASLHPGGAPPAVESLATDPWPMRGVTVYAPLDAVADALTTYRFQPDGALDTDDATVVVSDTGPGWVELRARSDGVDPADSADGTDDVVVFFLQPAADHLTVIRPVRAATPPRARQLDLWRYHSAQLSGLRDELEAAHRAGEIGAGEIGAGEIGVDDDASFTPLPAELVGMPPASTEARRAPLRVVVARKWEPAEGIAGFELQSVSGTLPTFQPGAHIDVHLPNGLIRQYSLTNGPGELDAYRIGVKREPKSRGGSSVLHDTIAEGDVLAISEPRNNFTLRRDSDRTMLIAGGIGVTPLLAMAQTLHNERLGFELHYFAQAPDHVAFREVLDRLGPAVHLHLGLSPDATGEALATICSNSGDDGQIYVCGPGPMLDAARRIAREAGWRDDAVHFEYFANATEIDDSTTFTVHLARSASSLEVAAGTTVLEALRDAGIDMVSSCEQGACGTCGVDVVDGAVVHQDVYLSDEEKARGTRMMTCVSRAAGDEITLDI